MFEASAVAFDGLCLAVESDGHKYSDSHPPGLPFRLLATSTITEIGPMALDGQDAISAPQSNFRGAKAPRGLKSALQVTNLF